MAPEQPVQPVVPFAAGAVAARIAVELGCEELPAMAHNRSLHLRPGPYLIMPNDWPHCATWCARVIEAAGFSSAARTLRGMRARAEQALVKLARAEAQRWQEVGRFDLAHTWQSKIDAALALSANRSYWYPVARADLEEFRANRRWEDRRRKQATMHDFASSSAAGPTFQDRLRAELCLKMQNPEAEPMDIMWSALTSLSRGGTPWVAIAELQSVLPFEQPMVEECIGSYASIGMIYFRQADQAVCLAEAWDEAAVDRQQLVANAVEWLEFFRSQQTT